MNAIVVALIVGALALLGTTASAWLASRRSAAEKERDYARQDEVAARVTDAAKQAEEAARLLAERQDEQAEAAQKAAQDLVDAQAETIRRTNEVARLAAETVLEARDPTTVKAGKAETGPVLVILAYPNGQRRNVLLRSYPRAGDLVRPTNGETDDPLIVEHVLWMESECDQPSMIAVVRPAATKGAP